MPKKSKRQSSRTDYAPANEFTSNTPSSRLAEFNPDYTYILNDLRRIGIIAGSFLVILIALSFILPLVIR